MIKKDKYLFKCLNYGDDYYEKVSNSHRVNRNNNVQKYKTICLWYNTRHKINTF